MSTEWSWARRAIRELFTRVNGLEKNNYSIPEIACLDDLIPKTRSLNPNASSFAPNPLLERGPVRETDVAQLGPEKPPSRYRREWQSLPSVSTWLLPVPCGRTDREEDLEVTRYAFTEPSPMMILSWLLRWRSNIYT